MQIELYNKVFNEYFRKEEPKKQIKQAVELVKSSKRLFFVGNGGSSAICSHMMEDFAKIANYPTFSFTDGALITCFANDYGYENAIAEWIKRHIQEGDLLFAISSSGESKNILNACDIFSERNQQVITLSGFKKANRLSQKGKINFHIPVENYGIAECFHQVIIHSILDEIEVGS